MSNLDLSEHHETEMLKFVKFVRYKREENIREIVGQFTDVQESRLLEEEYTLDDVENICQNLLMVVKSSVQQELEHASKAQSLMLRELFKQAQRVDLQLHVDTALLENATLLKEMVRYEEILNTPAGAARADLQGGFVGGQKLPSMAGRSDMNVQQENQTLKAENEKLKKDLETARSQLENLKVSQQVADRDVEMLRKQVGALNSDGAKDSKEKELAQKDEENTYLRRQLADLEANLRSGGAGAGTSDAKVQEIVQQLGSLQNTLAKTQAEKAKAEELVDAKVNQSAQFQSLKKMLDKKNEVIKALRKELAELKPDN